MTKIKRSLEKAFDLTPEVEVYVAGGDRQGKASIPVHATKRRNAGAVRGSTRSKPNPRKTTPVEKQSLVAFSTRISQALLDDLCMCMATRKIKSQAPWKQQEIVEKALRDWLAKNGAKET